MPVFISAVLMAAALQNCCKLSLLKRPVQYVLLLLLALLPLLLAPAAAKASMLEFRTMLSRAETLNELCGLVIIQELANIILAFSLLGEEPGKRTGSWYVKVGHYLKFTAFLPSILLFYGVWYLQMYLFNTFVEYSFDIITVALAVLLPLSGLLAMELMRFIFRDRSRRILAVMHLEYLLLIPAIFLPVAATAGFIDTGECFDFRQPAELLLWFVILLSVATTVFYLLKYKRKGKSYVRSNTNS